MACAGCERRRQAMKAMLDASLAHVKRMATLRRGGDPDGKAPNAAEAAGPATHKAAATPRGQQADNPRPAHRQRSVAADTGAGADPGRKPVRRVRKARRGT